jgi:hypothetical protein
MPGKNRATGYTDYFKGNTKTPGSYDDEEETAVPDTAKARKLAIQRRLKRKRM